MLLQQLLVTDMSLTLHYQLSDAYKHFFLRSYHPVLALAAYGYFMI